MHVLLVRTSRLATVAALATLAACSGLGTGPQLPADTGKGPQLTALAAVATITDGNEFFQWLPPIARQLPKIQSKFDPALDPVVKICAFNTTSQSCGADVATFSLTSGTGGMPLRVSPGQGMYRAIWQPKRSDVSVAGPVLPGNIYRIRVELRGRVYGVADIRISTACKAEREQEEREGKEREREKESERDGLKPPSKENDKDKSKGKSKSAGVAYSSVGDDRSSSASSDRTHDASYDDNDDDHDGIDDDATVCASPADPNVAGYVLVDRQGSLPIKFRLAAGMVDPRDVSYFAAGGVYTCALAPDRTAQCWGDNLYGVLGSGLVSNAAGGVAPSFRSSPTPVNGGIVFAEVASGFSHACGRTPIGEAYCWGRGDMGQLGNGTPVLSNPAPTRVASPVAFTQIAAGTFHTCGLDATGQAYCWGLNSAGALGIGTVSSTYMETTPVPAAAGLRFRNIAAAQEVTCGETLEGALYCWGSNRLGLLGGGQAIGAETGVPALVPGVSSLRSLSLGQSLACAVTQANVTSCWGSDQFGGLGQGTITGALQATPVVVPVPVPLRAVSAGFGHACGQATDSTAVCWGRNDQGQLGRGVRTPYPDAGIATPFAVLGGERFAAVSSGGLHACGLLPTGFAKCWGLNAAGQIGNGTTGIGIPTPTLVNSPGFLLP